MNINKCIHQRSFSILYVALSFSFRPFKPQLVQVIRSLFTFHLSLFLFTSNIKRQDVCENDFQNDSRRIVTRQTKKSDTISRTMRPILWSFKAGKFLHEIQCNTKSENHTMKLEQTESPAIDGEKLIRRKLLRDKETFSIGSCGTRIVPTL